MTNNHIDKLSPKRKKIFRLVREFGLSHKEVSEIMGLSIKTVKKQINKSLRILRFLHQILLSSNSAGHYG
ncbi:MAG: hypothetical protein H0X41_14450 [Chitinophagaceae bacterium]|nr:hypothetical protein [Chitinophagaceae bacterium]